MGAGDEIFEIFGQDYDLAAIRASVIEEDEAGMHFVCEDAFEAESHFDFRPI